MKLVLTAALLAMLATPAFAGYSNKAAAKPDEAIGKAAEGFFSAWNVHDTKAMAAFWASDATLINPMGRVARGNAEIEKLLTDEQTTVFKASTAKVVEFKATRWIGSNMAFCDGELVVDGALGPDGSALPQMKLHLAVLMEKKGDRWLFAEARPYAFPPPPPPPPEPGK